MASTLSDMITFQVQQPTGELKVIEVPGDINLSLMEVLKASEYNIAATCGGMALCATCHIEVVKGLEKLNDRTDAELDMLDTLPSASSNSRLACQIRVNENLRGIVMRLKEGN